MEDIKIGDLIRSKLNPSSDAVKFVYDFEDGSIGIAFVSGSSRGMRAVFPKKMWFKDGDTLNEVIRPQAIKP